MGEARPQGVQDLTDVSPSGPAYINLRRNLAISMVPCRSLS
jgi:hypothetical protein